MTLIARLAAELETLKNNALAVEAAQRKFESAKAEVKETAELFQLAVLIQDFKSADEADAARKAAKAEVELARKALCDAMSKPFSKGRIADTERKLEEAKRSQAPLKSSPFAGLDHLVWTHHS